LFSKSEISVPSAAEVMADGGGFQPLLFKKNGAQMVACFTAMARIGSFADQTPYSLTIKGSELLRRIPAGYGLVVNPGQEVGFDVSPDGLKRIFGEL